MVRISRNTALMIIHDLMFDVIMVIGIGSSSAISMSKFMKITAIRKNRDENGSRAKFFGSNPHSNGDLFSRSSLIFLEIRVVSTKPQFAKTFLKRHGDILGRIITGDETWVFHV